MKIKDPILFGKIRIFFKEYLPVVQRKPQHYYIVPLYSEYLFRISAECMPTKAARGDIR